MERGWKKFERRLAGLLGTTRIPVTGERHGADFETPMFCFQAKKRKTFPTYVAEWLDAICGKAGCRAPAKIGVVVLQRPRALDLDALVVMRLRDFIDLHGPARPAELHVPVHAGQDDAPASTDGQR